MSSARFRRCAGALVVAVIAVGSLTACQSHVGAAAYVGSTRISESTVGKYVGPTAKLTDSQNGPENPKSDVLNELIHLELVNRVFRTLPSGPPTAAELDAGRADTLSSNNIPSLAALEASVEGSGFTKAFASLALDDVTLSTILEADLNGPGDGSAVAAAIAKLGVKVSVSPRYGDWDPQTTSVSAGPSLPSFLTVSSADASTTDVTS